MTGILILNYNNTIDLKRCIDSIFKQIPLEEVKIVVVDNGSSNAISDDVEDYLVQKVEYESFLILDGVPDEETRLPLLSYLKLSCNVGYARGNNAGLLLLSKDPSIINVMIINSDIVLTEDIVTPQLELLSSLNNVGAVSPLLLHPNGEIDYSCARTSLNKDSLLSFSLVRRKQYMSLLHKSLILYNAPSLLKQDRVAIDLPSGSCMMLKMQVMKEIGGFDDNTFLYYEENILYKRLQAKGYINYILPKISCIHVGGATTRTARTSYFLKKCNYKSLLYYLQTYEQCSYFEMIILRLSAFIILCRLWLGAYFRRNFNK